MTGANRGVTVITEGFFLATSCEFRNNTAPYRTQSWSGVVTSGVATSAWKQGPTSVTFDSCRFFNNSAHFETTGPRQGPRQLGRKPTAAIANANGQATVLLVRNTKAIEGSFPYPFAVRAGGTLLFEGRPVGGVQDTLFPVASDTQTEFGFADDGGVIVFRDLPTFHQSHVNLTDGSVTNIAGLCPAFTDQTMEYRVRDSKEVVPDGDSCFKTSSSGSSECNR